MKVDPPIFTQSLAQSAAPVRPSQDASEARRAFAALLSAANQRSTLPREPATDSAPARSTNGANAAPSVKAEEAAPTSGLARPGRVIDIRV